MATHERRHFGRRLRDRRESLRLSREEVGALAGGLSASTVKRAEESPYPPKRGRTFRGLAQALGLTPHEMETEWTGLGAIIRSNETNRIPVINVGYDPHAISTERFFAIPFDDLDPRDEDRRNYAVVDAYICGIYDPIMSFKSFAIQIPDDSLQPEVMRGDVVVFSAEQRFESGSLAFVLLDGKAVRGCIAFMYDEQDRFRLFQPNAGIKRIFVPRENAEFVAPAVARVRADSFTDSMLMAGAPKQGQKRQVASRKSRK